MCSTVEHARVAGRFPSDRARLELLRAGGASCASASGQEPSVSVIVIAAHPRVATGHAVRTSLAQGPCVREVLVVGPIWSPAVCATWQTLGAGDPRLRLLPVARSGLAPAEPRARHRVRAAQYLRAALPFTSGDWITVCAEDAVLADGFVPGLLAIARAHSLELAWGSDDAPLSDRAFGGTLWAAALAALAPDDHAGWDGVPADAAWWARLTDAGVRGPGAEPVP